MNNNALKTPPTVLVLSGNDPSGGAGVTADIQAISANQAHPAPSLTSLTVQDTVNAYQVSAVEPDLVRQQAQAILDDLDVAAIKIGLLATAPIARTVATLLKENAAIPVVLDPVLVAAGGARLATDELRQVLLQQLVQCATVLTPNVDELLSLVPDAADTDARARVLLDKGALWVLAKGGDAATDDVRNVLYGPDGFRQAWTWPRLPGRFHGSGCTLASALAALIANGCEIVDAVARAQQYTAQTLEQAWRPGQGQQVPRRIVDGVRQ